MSNVIKYQISSNADAGYITPSRNTQSSTLRSVPSSPGRQFLDTQVSLAPTHVSKLVGWLVGWLVTLSDFQSLVSNGRSNKKSSKNKVHLFSNFASGRTLPTHENVYEGLNALKCI